MKGIPPTEFPNRMTPVSNKIYLYTGSNFKSPDLPPIPIPPQISIRKEAEVTKVENSKTINQPNQSKSNNSSNSQEERKLISSINNGGNSFLSLYSFYFEPIQVKVNLYFYSV